jgi:hypothetical protein
MLPTPNESVIFRSLSEGAILFSAAEEAYYGLNGVAAEIWELLQSGHQTLESLCAALSARHPSVPARMLRDDVKDLLASLTELGLLIPAPGHRDARVDDVSAEARFA